MCEGGMDESKEMVAGVREGGREGGAEGGTEGEREGERERWRNGEAVRVSE